MNRFALRRRSPYGGVLKYLWFCLGFSLVSPMFRFGFSFGFALVPLALALVSFWSDFPSVSLWFAFGFLLDWKSLYGNAMIKQE